MLFTSVIGGRDLVTGKVPDSAEEQARNVFKILQKVLDKFGATAGDVAMVHVFIKEPSVRALVNVPWVEMFPDEHSRPARHTTMDEAWVACPDRGHRRGRAEVDRRGPNVIGRRMLRHCCSSSIHQPWRAKPWGSAQGLEPAPQLNVRMLRATSPFANAS
jgi:enamine deaminase RidA (YjgF/YER057c/UK114 family)